MQELPHALPFEQILQQLDRLGASGISVYVSAGAFELIGIFVFVEVPEHPAIKNAGNMKIKVRK